MDYYRSGNHRRGPPPDQWVDQYLDGTAARMWDGLIGARRRCREPSYRKWIVDTLKTNGCKTVLDCACGTGPDSIILVEEGFTVVSTDASDQMLKYALKERWNRRKEPGFDNWVIEEANWLTLVDDIDVIPPGGFDAVLCLGGSFQHLPDFDGDGKQRQKALHNMMSVVKPGGLLIVDHRNFDSLLKNSVHRHRQTSIIYECQMDVKTSVLYMDGRAVWQTAYYIFDASELLKTGKNKELAELADEKGVIRFTLSSYPVKVHDFIEELKAAYGREVKYELTGECKPLGEIADPVYYMYVVHKPDDSKNLDYCNGV